MKKKILVFGIMMLVLFLSGCTKQKESNDEINEEFQQIMNYIMPDSEGDNVSLYQVDNFVYIIHSKDKLIEHNNIVGKEFRFTLSDDGRILDVQIP